MYFAFTRTFGGLV